MATGIGSDAGVVGASDVAPSGVAFLAAAT